MCFSECMGFFLCFHWRTLNLYRIVFQGYFMPYTQTYNAVKVKLESASFRFYSAHRRKQTNGGRIVLLVLLVDCDNRPYLQTNIYLIYFFSNKWRPLYVTN